MTADPAAESTRDNVAAGMRYWQTGHGRRQTALLVHGWCCDHTFMRPIATHLAREHTRTYSVDMRGHGQSPVGDRGFSVEEFGQDLRNFMSELDLRDVILIGHSMGGVWSLAAAAEARDRIAALILLDSAVAAPPGTADEVAAFAAALRGDDWQEARDAAIRSYFIPESDPRLVRWVLERMGRPSQAVAAGAVAGLAEFVEAGGDHALSQWGRPLLYVGGPTPFADYDRLRELVPDPAIGQVVGSGHFLQFEVPDQTNAMIDRYLRLAGLD